MAQKTNIIKKRPQTRKKSKKYSVIVVLLCVLIVLAIGGGIIVYINKDKIFNKGQESSESSTSDSRLETRKTGDEKKEDQKNDEKKEGTSSTRDGSNREEGKESIAQYSGEDPNKLQEITGSINFAGISEGEFIVSATLDQELGNSGTCKFTIMQGSSIIITQEVITSAGPSTSFCEYSAPATSINAGHYDINIEVRTDSKKGVIGGEVNI